MLGWAWCGLHKKRAETRYVELVFLRPVESVGQAVHPGRETSMHYFSCLGGTDTDSIKSASGYVTLNL
jgi:hypothetical protein